MPEPASGAVATVATTKVSIKLFAVAAGVAGAALMVAIRPNLSRKQLAMHMLTAGCLSYLGHGIVVALLAQYTGLDLTKWASDDAANLHVLVAFVIGGLSWGLIGGMYWFREEFGTKPIEAIQAIRNLRSGGASVIGATPASLATSCRVTAPRLRSSARPGRSLR